MNATTLDEKIDIVRQFNRFFTRQIGVLREGLLHTDYSLTEARIIFEIANRNHVTASDLVRELGLDAGYLSRAVSKLEAQSVVSRVRSEVDGRQRLLKLTEEGESVFRVLNQRSHEEVGEMLNRLSDEEQSQLLSAMQTIQNLLDEGFKFAEPFYLRHHQPGDMGWVTHRHGVLYAQEYGFDETFEALVAEIVANFVKNYDPVYERCWVAEMNGEIVGSVFVVRADAKTAKLRLLLVEPKARGVGLGNRLVTECIRFSKQAGYEKLILWTNSVLLEARHIYEKKGFTLVESEAHHSFGHDLVGEIWELIL